MSTQQPSQLSSQAARSTAAQSARPVLHERQIEFDEDTSFMGSPAELTVQDFMIPFNDPNYHSFTMESTAIATDLMEGRSSFNRRAEVALNPLLSGREAKSLHQQIAADVRKAVVLRIDAHLNQKVKEEAAHEEFSASSRERIIHDQIKFAKLAKGYKAKPGPPTGQKRRRDDGDDGHGGDEDDEDGPGPDDFGPRSKWSLSRLSSIDRETLERYPPPRRGGPTDSHESRDEDGEDEDREDEALGQNGAMGPANPPNRYVYVPITGGPTSLCPICNHPDIRLEQFMCGTCGFGT